MLVVLTVSIQKANSELNQPLPDIREADDIPYHARSKIHVDGHPSPLRTQQTAGRRVSQFHLHHRSEVRRAAMPGLPGIQTREPWTEGARGDLTTLTSVFPKEYEKMD